MDGINAVTRRLGGVPPDPDGMNNQRAMWAGAAIDTLMAETNCSHGEEALGDLLCDLMHWADRNKLDFDDMLRRAQNNYEAETTP